MIHIGHKGDFKFTSDFLAYMNSSSTFMSILDKYGRIGVEALRLATPVDTGVSSESWSYEIHATKGGGIIKWSNSNVTSTGVPVVVLLQYGHATKTGGYIQGIDFINPVIRPLFARFEDEIWKEIRTL